MKNSINILLLYELDSELYGDLCVSICLVFPHNANIDDFEVHFVISALFVCLNISVLLKMTWCKCRQSVDYLLQNFETHISI